MGRARGRSRRKPKTFVKAFHKKRDAISQKMCTSLRLLTILEDRQILTKLQRQTIMEISDDYERANKLMDELERADDAKLSDFYVALVETGQRHVVNIILKRETHVDEFVQSSCPSSESSQEIENIDPRSTEQEHVSDHTRKRTKDSQPETQQHVTSEKRRKTSADSDPSCSKDAVQAGSPGSVKKGEQLVELSPKATLHESGNAHLIAPDTDEFRLIDLHKLLDMRYETSTINARVLSVSDLLKPRNSSSLVNEYFEMYISDGESRARVVVYDNAELHEPCKVLKGADVVIAAGSYTVRRDTRAYTCMHKEYIALTRAPSLRQPHRHSGD